MHPNHARRCVSRACAPTRNELTGPSLQGMASKSVRKRKNILQSRDRKREEPDNVGPRLFAPSSNLVDRRSGRGHHGRSTCSYLRLRLVSRTNSLRTSRHLGRALFFSSSHTTSQAHSWAENCTVNCTVARLRPRDRFQLGQDKVRLGAPLVLSFTVSCQKLYLITRAQVTADASSR